MMPEQMLFSICPSMSCLPKFWYMYLIPYTNFMVIVEACASKKIGALVHSILIHSMKFLSPELALYLFKSGADMQDCYSFTCHLSWTFGLSPKWSLLKSFLLAVLADVHLNWLNWFHSLILERSLLVILL